MDGEAASLFGPPRSARVEELNGRPTLFVDGQPVAPMFYALTDVPGGRWTWEELPQHNLRQFCRQGVRLFQVNLYFDHVWMEDGSLDLTIARRQLEGVHAACPDGAVVIRFHVTAPRWWRDRHPEEWVRYADTDYFDEDFHGSSMRPIAYDNLPVRRVSLASTRYREEATQKFTEFVRLLSAAPEAANLIGLHIADGVYGEWHYWGFFEHEPDLSEPMTRYFRNWLRAKYGDEAGLRQAWRRPDASFEAAEVPGMAERRTTAGVFRDPRQEQPVIDYYRAQHELVAESVLHYAGIAKKTWPRPFLTGTFFGYYFSTFGRQSAGCHLEMMRIFESPDIDYVAAPNAYEPAASKLGDPYHARGLVTTARLHGKLWLDEMDHEPTIPVAADERRDVLLANSLASVRRNTLFSAAQGMGLWYFDFGVAGVDLDGFRYDEHGSRGTWDHEDVLNDIGAMKRILDAKRDQPFRTGADVLFVYDTQAYYYTASLMNSDPVSRTLEDYLPLAAWRTGVSLDTIHLSDLESIDLSPYRVIVFGNVFALTRSRRKLIKERAGGGERTLVWTYAPGYVDLDENRLDPDAVSEVTGFRLAPVTLENAPEIALALPDGEVTYRAADEPFRPLFSVDDPEAEVLGVYAENGRAAVARKEFGHHDAWYIAAPGKITEPIGHILRSSGAHIYSPHGDVVYAGSGLLVVHGAAGGRRSVVLRNGTTRTFNLPEDRAFTLVLDSETGETLLDP